MVAVLPPLCALAVDDRGTTRTISLSEEVDIAVVPALKAAAQAAFSDSGCQTLVIDLSATTFIETTAIEALYEAYRRSAQDGLRLVLIPPAPTVKRAFALCGLAEVLPFAAQADDKVTAPLSL